MATSLDLDKEAVLEALRPYLQGTGTRLYLFGSWARGEGRRASDLDQALQTYLREVEGLEGGSPKGVFRLAREAGLLLDEEVRLALAMVDDRNLTVHTYNEALAQAIFRRLPHYTRLMESVLGRLR